MCWCCTMWEVFISKRFNRVIGLGIFRTISCARSDMQGPRSKRYQFRNTYLAGVPHLQNLESPLLIVLILSVGLGQRLMRLQLRSIVDRLSLRARARSSDLRVPILDLLSGPLFRELQFERHRASLCKLPMLKDLLEAPDIQTLETLHSATRSLYQLVAATRDIIFLSGSRATLRTSSWVGRWHIIVIKVKRLWMTRVGWQRRVCGLPGYTWETLKPRVSLTCFAWTQIVSAKL